jgi:hypothetical protein
MRVASSLALSARVFVMVVFSKFVREVIAAPFSLVESAAGEISL